MKRRTQERLQILSQIGNMIVAYIFWPLYLTHVLLKLW